MQRGRRINNIPKQQIKVEKLYLEGLRSRSMKEIALSVGVSSMTVYRWAKQYGWEETYKQKYEEKLSKIPEGMDKLIFIGMHRLPKVSKKRPENRALEK